MIASSIIRTIILLVIMKPRHHTNAFVLQSILGDLQHIKSGTDGKSHGSEGAGGGVTTTSRQLDATQRLYENSSRLGNCETLIDDLDHHLELLENDLEGGQARALKKQRRMLRDVLSPMIAATMETTTAAAVHLAPIPSVKRYNTQQEVQRRNAVKGSKNPDQQIIKNYLKENKSASSAAKRKASSIETPSTVTPPNKPPSKRQTRNNKHKNAKEFTLKDLLPLPQIDSLYTIGEAVNHAIAIMGDKRAQTNNGKSPSKSKIFQAMVESGYLPAKNRATFYRLLQEIEKGKIIPLTQQATMGRKPILTQEELNVIVEDEISKHHGCAFQSSDIARVLVDAEKRKKLERGVLPSDRQVCKSTIDNYRVQFANHPEVSLTQNTVVKSTTRATAESSIRAVISLLVLIASGHFVPIEEECPEIIAQLRAADDKCRLLYDMIVDALGGVSVYPIKPEYIFSTDDTTCYIFEGIVNGEEKWTLVTKDSIRKSGTNAVYRVEDSKIMNGMRVKLTFTFSAAGMCAPLFVTVSGLSEEEMPNKPFLHMKVPGLCIGGGGVTVGNNSEGHVFFMRKMEGADRTRYEYYQREVLIPFINGVRMELDDFDASAGTNIPTKLTAASWCDGDISQVATVVSDIEKLTENRIHGMKQNAARSAAEQAADLAKVFNTMKQLIKKYSGDKSAGTRSMKNKLTAAMKELEERGELKISKPNHKKALLDFLAILPLVATKAATVDNIQHGFIENGMIDRETKRFPVLANILGTCKRDVLLKELEMLLEAFPHLLDHVNRTGRIPEEVFDHYGFDRDKTPNGEEYIRPDSIRQTHMRRAEFLTSKFQASLRLKDIEEKKMAVAAKRAKENLLHQKRLEANESIVKKLCDMIEKEASESNLEHCRLKHFAKLASPELQAFIRYHDDSIRYVSRDIPTKKGTLDEAIRGMRNRILVAYQCRNKPCLLDEDLPHDLDQEDEDDEEEAIQLDDIVAVHRVGGAEDISLSASELLCNKDWIQLIVKLFHLDEYTNVPLYITSEDPLDELQMKERADLQAKADILQKILCQRLKDHIRSRASTRMDHWVWKFVRRNLPVVAAYMVVAGHTKSRINCVKEDQSLLSPNANKFAPCGRFPLHEGCYLFFDPDNCVFIRSGKVTGSGVESRLKQHMSGSEAQIASSQFYDQYPSEKSSRADKRDKRGYFEDLLAVFAAGFDPNGDICDCVGKDVKRGGVLLLSEYEKDKIKSSKLDGKMTETEKFRAILAYQFELVYDLAIAPRDNVSKSPGFESFIGIFGGVE